MPEKTPRCTCGGILQRNVRVRGFDGFRVVTYRCDDCSRLYKKPPSLEPAGKGGQ